MNMSRGFSLVELMIALTLSLLLLSATLVVHGASTRIVTTQRALNVQTDALVFASDILSRHLREAGFGGTDTTPPVQGTLTEVSVAYRYDTDRDLAAHAGADCRGSVLDAGALSQDTFRIESVGGRPTLVCEAGGVVEPLVPGISGLTFRYRVDDQFLPAGDLPQGADEWASVTAVRMALTAEGLATADVADRVLTVTVALRSRL